jgi:hypothetical protein
MNTELPSSAVFTSSERELGGKKTQFLGDKKQPENAYVESNRLQQ